MNIHCVTLVGLVSFVASGLLAQPDESVAHRAFGGIQPVISPDGQLIALSFQGAICRMPSGGGTLIRLTRAEGWDVEPAWSPDGKQIAFINAPAFNVGPLRLISAEDGSPIKLSKEVFARGRLQFHPEGKRLLGTFVSRGQPDRLQWLDLTSGELIPANIGRRAATERAAIKWALSPDGTTILFATFQDQPGEQSGNNGSSTDLWRASAMGGEPQKIARWPSRIYSLVWDANGHGVYVVTDRGVAYNDLWYIPLQRPLEDARKITFGQADEDWPSVSTDGHWLLHTENNERATALMRIDLRTGQRQTLAIDSIDFRQPTARLRLILTDAESGEPLVARVSVQQQGGKFHFPLGALYRLTSGIGHFYARHKAELAVPAGWSIRT